MTLADLNALPQEEFTARLGWLYEHSPWVAERAWNTRPFPSISALRSALARQVEESSHSEKLGLLQAHPDLGTRVRMSDASKAEQHGAGLDRLTPDDYDTLLALNRQYRERFGHPFIYAVKGSSNHEIIAALRRRLESSAESEMAEALGQVHRIASFRLEEVCCDSANPR